MTNGLAGRARLSLVIPAWNEQETIADAIVQAQDALNSLTSEFEIIVVDDGSTDQTADIVRAAASLDPRVKLQQHSGNRGYGAALRTGFQAATLDLVAFTDADCQFDLRDLGKMLPLTERSDITCGYRVDRQDTAPRRFYSWGYNKLARLLLGSQVRDVDCALKILRRDRLLSIVPESDNYFANAEMLATAQMRGLSVEEVGVRHRARARGKSKVSLREVPKTLIPLLRFWWSRVLFPAATVAPTRAAGWTKNPLSDQLPLTIQTEPLR